LVRTISVGIVGCGKQSEKHARALKAASAVEITATDLDRPLAEAFCRREGARLASSAQALIADPALDAVLICTPTPSHMELVADSLRQGKHVFCEKPLCQTVAEAETLLAIEASSGRFGMVGYLYRFVPAFEALRRWFQPGAEGGEAVMGRLVHAFLRIGGRGSHRPWKHQRSQSGGAVSEMLVHMVDLMHWLFGPASHARLLSHQLLRDTRAIGGRAFAVDAEDYVLLECRLERGGTALLLADMVTPSFQQYLEAQATNGSFFGSIRPDMPTEVFLNTARGELKAGSNRLASSSDDLYRRQMECFLACVESGRPPDRNRFEDSLTVNRTLEQAALAGSQSSIVTDSLEQPS
jgi:myo-inositol 2-dehydrogenase / D-chiro-inositol 1-dehydrogenase